MNVLFFASIAEYTGTERITLEPVRNTVELKSALQKIYPRLDEFSYAIAVNHVVTHNNTDLVETDEIAILPPFSGG